MLNNMGFVLRLCCLVKHVRYGFTQLLRACQEEMTKDSGCQLKSRNAMATMTPEVGHWRSSNAGHFSE